MTNTVSTNIKQALLLSAGLFLVGKKKVEELVKELEANGLNKEEAEKTAREVLDSARKHKDTLMSTIAEELSKHVNIATKDDIKHIDKALKDIAKKLDS